MPLYPINVFYRSVPCLGLIAGAMVWNSVFPEHIRLRDRIKHNAYTYIHPLELEMQQKQAALQAAENAGGDDADE